MPEESAPDRASTSVSRLTLGIVVTTLCRLVLNTARRFVYPFAPVLSRGLGVSLTNFTSIIAANQIAGFLGVVFAPLGDRFGYRMMMLAGLGSLTVGMATGGVFPFYGTVLIAFFLAGLSNGIFGPALQAYSAP